VTGAGAGTKFSSRARAHDTGIRDILPVAIFIPNSNLQKLSIGMHSFENPL